MGVFSVGFLHSFFFTKTFFIEAKMSKIGIMQLKKYRTFYGKGILREIGGKNSPKTKKVKKVKPKVTISTHDIFETYDPYSSPDELSDEDEIAIEKQEAVSKETLLAQIEREVYRTLPEDSDEDMFEYWEKEIEKRLKLKMKENCSV